MPCRPRSPIFGQRWRGKRSSRSISSASGAISSAAKPATLSRSMSAVSPRSKLRLGRRLGIMLAPFGLAPLLSTGAMDARMAFDAHHGLLHLGTEALAPRFGGIDLHV